MAITGGAALVGALAVGTEVATITTVMMVGLAVTAVGMVTKNAMLTKIGGGLGMGAGGAGLAGLGSAGAGAASEGAAAAGQAAESAVAPGSLAAGNVAEGQIAVGGAMDATSGVTATPLAESAAGGYGGVAEGTSATSEASAAMNGAANPNAGNSIAEGINATSPAAQSIAAPSAAQAGTGAPAGFGGVGGSGATSAAPASSIGDSLGAQSSVVPGPQAAAPVTPTVGAPVTPTDGAVPAPNSGMPAPGSAASGTTGSGAPNGFSNPAGTPAGNVVAQDPANWWTSMSDWFTKLDPHSKLAVGQTAAGLVQGIGSGAGTYMSNEQKLALDKQKYADQVSNANAVPTVGLSVNQGYVRPTGLINSAKKV